MALSLCLLVNWRKFCRFGNFSLSRFLLLPLLLALSLSLASRFLASSRSLSSSHYRSPSLAPYIPNSIEEDTTDEDSTPLISSKKRERSETVLESSRLDEENSTKETSKPKKRKIDESEHERIRQPTRICTSIVSPSLFMIRYSQKTHRKIWNTTISIKIASLQRQLKRLFWNLPTIWERFNFLTKMTNRIKLSFEVKILCIYVWHSGFCYSTVVFNFKKIVSVCSWVRFMCAFFLKKQCNILFFLFDRVKESQKLLTIWPYSTTPRRLFNFFFLIVIVSVCYTIWLILE